MKLLTKFSSLQKRRLIGVILGLLMGAMIGGVMLLQDIASDEALSRRDPAALAFEKEPDRWLAHPRPASEFERSVVAGELKAVAVSGLLVLFTDRKGGHFSTRLVDCGMGGCTNTIRARLGELSVQKGFVLTSTEIDPRTASQRFNQSLSDLGRATLALLPIMLIIGLMVYQMRGGSLAMGGTKLADKPETKFKDVIGADEAKNALRRVAAFMKDPAEYAKVGARAPRGVLIDGPPGTGKTLLAKALAGECGANFITVDGSHFSSMFYGAGIGKVKELFQRARKSAPCIIFIDELDGIGKRSRGENGGGEQEQNRIINRILVELDGFSPLENVVVIGATNHVDNIDKAMRRPGRFDMLVSTSLPTPPEREALFAFYLGEVKADEGMDLPSFARTSVGMSPADIANCVNRAASYAAEAGDATVASEHLYKSIETFQLGGEVSSTKSILTKATLNRLAVHEGGHGLVAHVLDAGSVERVSIEPRGGALGVTYVARHTEEPLYGEQELKSRLAMMLAGREAEMLVFGNTSSGASDDLKRASELATSMIGSYGFSKTFGLLSMAGVPKELIGPDIQRGVLDEARLLLEQAQSECRRVLTEHRDRLDHLTAVLLERETISGASLKALLDGRVLAEA